MLTVLFVILVLFTFGKLISVVDGQRVSSSELGHYLHSEYNMARDSRATMQVLRNL